MGFRASYMKGIWTPKCIKPWIPPAGPAFEFYHVAECIASLIQFYMFTNVLFLVCVLCDSWLTIVVRPSEDNKYVMMESFNTKQNQLQVCITVMIRDCRRAQKSAMKEFTCRISFTGCGKPLRSAICTRSGLYIVFESGVCRHSSLINKQRKVCI